MSPSAEAKTAELKLPTYQTVIAQSHTTSDSSSTYLLRRSSLIGLWSKSPDIVRSQSPQQRLQEGNRSPLMGFSQVGGFSP